MPQANRGRIRYRRNIIPQAMRKGERVVDERSGALQYSRDCVQFHGGWTHKRYGPPIDPRTDQYIP